MRTFTPAAEQRLKGLHPKLISVLRHAKQASKWDFTIAQGVRTKEEAFVNFGKGRTAAQCEAGGCPAKYSQPHLRRVTFLNHALSTNHLEKADGLGYAADVLVEPFDYLPEHDKRYADINTVVQAAARIEGVKVVWGGTWKRPTTDLPHFELHL